MDWRNKPGNIVSVVTASGVPLPQEVNPSYSSHRWPGHVTLVTLCIVCKALPSNIFKVRNLLIFQPILIKETIA